MESSEVDADSFLLSKEIEIKEREANLLRIIMRCKKLGIDIPAATWNTEDVSQPNGMAPYSRAIEKKELPSSVSPKCGDADELVEPRIEDFGLSEEGLHAAIQLPVLAMRNFKPVESFQPFKPKQYRLDSSESIDGSPLSLRTVPFDRPSGSDPTFACTPEVCQMNKKSKAPDRGRRYESMCIATPNVTPKCMGALLREPKNYASVGQKHLAKRQSLVSPEEPELTYTMDQFKSFVINENNNAFLTNCLVPSASSSQTPEEPEFVISTKDEDVSLSDLQMPQSPQLSLDWLKLGLNAGSHLF